MVICLGSCSQILQQQAMVCCKGVTLALMCRLQRLGSPSLADPAEWAPQQLLNCAGSGVLPRTADTQHGASPPGSVACFVAGAMKLHSA